MGHNIMDYSLLVGVFRQQHVPYAQYEFRNVAFVAIIDILQVSDLLYMRAYIVGLGFG